MPPINLYELVNWYQFGDIKQPPKPAIVLGKGNQGLVLAVLDFNGGDGTAVKILYRKTGVRHADDPMNIQRPELKRDRGCWDYVERTPKPKKTVHPALIGSGANGS